LTSHSHQTAPTQFVEASDIRFAYRRFGKPAGTPLVFNQHFTGTMDHWDPAVTDGLATQREVILFNNAGVSSSSGGGSDLLQANDGSELMFASFYRRTVAPRLPGPVTRLSMRVFPIQ
jgi:pimeloyl-ACP methyl ester carboxylesterase